MPAQLTCFPPLGQAPKTWLCHVDFPFPCRWLWRGKPDGASGRFTAALG